MIQLLDSGGLRLAGYLISAVAAIVAGCRERRSPSRDERHLWPAFWFITALMLASMGIARAADIAGILSDLGRDQAVSGGWYETRRQFQALIVGGMTAAWSITVAVAIWRVPERRRRYPPAAIAVFSLVCFAAVRVVSLHQVDALLYNRDLAGVRLVAATELLLLAITALSMFWFPFVMRHDARSADTSGDVDARGPWPDPSPGKRW